MDKNNIGDKLEEDKNKLIYSRLNKNKKIEDNKIKFKRFIKTTINSFIIFNIAIIGYDVSSEILEDIECKYAISKVDENSTGLVENYINKCECGITLKDRLLGREDKNGASIVYSDELKENLRLSLKENMRLDDKEIDKIIKENFE